MAIGNIPGLILLGGATVLLVLASISTPVVNDFHYLKVHFDGVSVAGQTEGSSTLYLGLWGACVNSAQGQTCTKESLGYGLNLSILNLNDDTHLSQTLLRGVAKALILIPVSAGITFIAFLFALSTNVFVDVLASIAALLGFLVTLIAFILASVVFITARHRINTGVSGADSELSNCYWFLLTALVADLLASCFVLFGCFKRRRAHNRGLANGGSDPAMSEKRHWWARNRNSAV